jgi:hypothetical protein
MATGQNKALIHTGLWLNALSSFIVRSQSVICVLRIDRITN